MLNVIIDVIVEAIGDGIGEMVTRRRDRRLERQGKVRCGLRLVRGRHEEFRSGRWVSGWAMIDARVTDFDRGSLSVTQVYPSSGRPPSLRERCFVLGDGQQIIRLVTDDACVFELSAPNDRLPAIVETLTSDRPPAALA